MNIHEILMLGRRFDNWWYSRAEPLSKAFIILAIGLTLFLLAWLPEKWRKK